MEQVHLPYNSLFDQSLLYESGEHSTYEYAPATANIVPVYDETKKEWFAYDAEVTIKGSPAAIEKEVDDHTVEIGQKVNYTVNVLCSPLSSGVVKIKY